MSDDTLKRAVLHELVFGDLPQVPLVKALARCPRCLNQTNLHQTDTDEYQCLACNEVFVTSASTKEK